MSRKLNSRTKSECSSHQPNFPPFGLTVLIICLPSPAASTFMTSSDLKSSGNYLFLFSMTFLFVGSFGLLGGWELLFPQTTSSASSSSSPSYLNFPYNLALFLPLFIPLSLYIVIARWTGEKYYRHSWEIYSFSPAFAHSPMRWHSLYRSFVFSARDWTLWVEMCN